jgi:hypothetical protein
MHRVHHPGPTRRAERPGPAPAADPRRAWLLSLGNQGVQRVLARLSTGASVPDAVLAAAPKAVYPEGIVKLAPKPEDITFNPAQSDDAVTHAALVPVDPGNYWRWIEFGPTAVRDTDANTEAVITHELVHVRQFLGWWHEYNALPAASREPWEDYVKRLSAGGRDRGPQELEAHATVLAYLPKLSGVERRQALLGLFSAFASAETFVPPPGVTPEATAAATAPDILAAFATTPDPAFGDTLWRALMTAEPGRAVVLRVLRDLEPIARAGYVDPARQEFYDGFLKRQGLTFAEVFPG